MDQTQKRAVPVQQHVNTNKPAGAPQQLTNGLALANMPRVTTRSTAQQQRVCSSPIISAPVQHAQPQPARYRNVQQPPQLSQFQQLYLSQANHPQFLFEYCEDINNAMLQAEEKYLVRQDYMSSQSAITVRYREVLIDWLSSVRGKYCLKIDTFALCISILDRFLERREITKDKLQLVGCVSLWIASKYEEIYPPELEDLVTISDRNFTREQFIMMERIILTILDFHVTVPYAHQFAERYIQALPDELYPNKNTILYLTLYIIESTYQHYIFVGHMTSRIATAAVSLALFFTGQASHFPTHLGRASGLEYADVMLIFKDLWSTIHEVHRLHAVKRDQQKNGIKGSKVFDSVYRIYYSKDWGFVPDLVLEFNEDSVPQPAPF